MDTIKVSVIIPVCNEEAYIRQCIKSVIRQTLREIEIICVDDGSRDNTWEILEQFAEQDGRIYLLRGQGKGGGAARNLALEKARGEYLSFVDGDDFYVRDDALELLWNSAFKKRAQIVGAGRLLWENDRGRPASGIIDQAFDESSEDDSAGRLAGKRLSYQEYPCIYGYQSFLFQRELIRSRNIKFYEGRRLQDPPFMMKAMLAAGDYYYLPVYTYGYRIGHRAPVFNKAVVMDVLNGLEEMAAFICDMDFDRLKEMIGEVLDSISVSVLKNVCSGDYEALERVFRIYALLQKKTQISAGAAFPCLLNHIASISEEYFFHCEDILRALTAGYSSIAVYGAGRYGANAVKALDRIGMKKKIRQIVVTKAPQKGQTLGGLTVARLSEEGLKRDGIELVIIAAAEKTQGEMEENLLRMEFSNYIKISDVMNRALEEKEKRGVDGT